MNDRPNRLKRATGARRGVTLVEITAVVAMSAAMFAVVSVLLVSVLKSAAGHTQAVAWQQTRQRLAQSWREDVHAARKVQLIETTDGQERKRLSARVAEVEYVAAAPGEIVRLLHADGKPVAREAFRLRPGESAEFVVDESVGTASILLETNSVESHPPAAAGRVEIVAAIGLDLRYGKEPSP